MTILPPNAGSPVTLFSEDTPYNVLRTIFEFLPGGVAVQYRYGPPPGPLAVKHFAIAGQTCPAPLLRLVCKTWRDTYEEMSSAIFSFCKNQNLPVVHRVITAIERRSGKKEETWGKEEKEQCIRLLFQRALKGARAVGPDLLTQNENDDVDLLRQNLHNESKHTGNLLDIAAAPWSNSDVDHALVSLIGCSNVEESRRDKTAAGIRAEPDLFPQITEFRPSLDSDQILAPFTKPDLLPVEIERCTQLQHVWVGKPISFDDTVKWLRRKLPLRTLCVRHKTLYTREQLDRLLDLVRTYGTCLLTWTPGQYVGQDDLWTLLIGNELYKEVVALLATLSPSELADTKNEVINVLFRPLHRFMGCRHHNGAILLVRNVHTGAMYTSLFYTRGYPSQQWFMKPMQPLNYPCL